jgi:hypothetical protein
MSTDRNYTDVKQSGIDSGAERVGDITGKPPTNEAIDRDKASKMANLLEGLEFPATKQEIRNHLNKRSPTMGNRINDMLEAVENKLDDGVEYKNAYDIERAAGLVEQADEDRGKPYVRDRALNVANKKRLDEDVRKDPYSGQESIWPANERDVSPNTPRGEDL